MEAGKCPNCLTALERPGESRGRPRRWCSDGCKRSGEGKMRRLHQALKALDRDKVRQLRHSNHAATIARIDELIEERQREYDRLAGAAPVDDE
jgi:hypothetical protein